MKNILIGNGINIQFDNKNYTTKSIVLRLLKNCDKDDFPRHIIVDYPYLMKNYLGKLFLEARAIIKGYYDLYAFGTVEKQSLIAFKERYASRLLTLKMTDIGFEDYYLVHDLVCHKTNTQNPDQWTIREAMKIAYLYAIYNDGKLEELYKNYSGKLIKELSSYDQIFTTNYDTNIEKATGKNVLHIHGSFSQKSDVYVASSFRNQLPDAPVRDIKIDEKYYYLYSNAISTYAGAYKEFQLKEASQANACVEKMASVYEEDEKIRQEIDRWCRCDNKLTRNLGYAIKLKANYPNLSFKDNYHFDKLKSINGELAILGLSPWNDYHIFESINAANIEKCIFWFYSEGDCLAVEKLLPTLKANGILFFRDAKDFWSKMNA